MIFRPRTPVVGTVCALLATLLGISLAPVLTTQATAGSSSGDLFSVGSYNIRADRTTSQFKRAVNAFRPSVDVAGLQEVNSDQKRHFLNSMRGWGSYNPKSEKQNPVIWRRSAFKLVDHRGAKVAAPRFVGNEKTGAPSHRDASYATVVRLRQRGTGVPISVVNIHLVAGGVHGGGCVKSAPRLCDLYKDMVAGLRRVTDRERQWAHGRVYVLGDMNDNYPSDKRYHRRPLAFAQLHGAGLVAHWERRRELRGGEGSGANAGAYLDQIWANRKPVAIAVKRSIKLSDHYPIVAAYHARTTR